MIPRATPSGSSHTPSCGSRQSIAHHTHPEKCAPYIHFSCTNTNGFIQGNMLNTPQAVPLICKASVVQNILTFDTPPKFGIGGMDEITSNDGEIVS